MQRGGSWDSKGPEPAQVSFKPLNFSLSPARVLADRAKKGFDLVTYPTIQFFDGRGANRPFLQELPDPVYPDYLGRVGGDQPGDGGKAGDPEGRYPDPALCRRNTESSGLPLSGDPGGILAIPIGQGHSNFGRYAEGQSGNPAQIIPSRLDPASGG